MYSTLSSVAMLDFTAVIGIIGDVISKNSLKKIDNVIYPSREPTSEPTSDSCNSDVTTLCWISAPLDYLTYESRFKKRQNL